MVNSSALWAFIFANVGLVVIGCLLAVLSLLAHRRSNGQRSYAIATLGFGCVVVAGFAEPVYMLQFEPDFLLTSAEFLSLQIVEDVLIGLGLGLLFYAITQHDSGSARDAPSTDAEDGWIVDHPSDD